MTKHIKPKAYEGRAYITELVPKKMTAEETRKYTQIVRRTKAMRIRNWLNYPKYTLNYWAYVFLMIGFLLIGMMGTFLLLIYSITDWDMAKQTVGVKISMLAIGILLIVATYFGTKKTTTIKNNKNEEV